MAAGLLRGASMRLEVLVGRSLAVSVHPFAAWRSSLRFARLLLLGSYFAAGYGAVLAGLLFFS
jgi:hypothetical protein